MSPAEDAITKLSFRLTLRGTLPGQSGVDFQRNVAAASVRLPIVVITGYGDVPMTVQAMKSGAIEFLTKPFRDQDLLDAVNVGLARDRARLDYRQSAPQQLDAEDQGRIARGTVPNGGQA